MHHTAPARAGTRRDPHLVLVGLVVVTVAILGVLAYQSASTSAPSSSDVRRGDLPAPAIEDHGVVTADNGALPGGVTVFDDEYPGIANLDPALIEALREAATDAASYGIEIQVNSGWRSPEYQEQLRREAIAEYGSEEEAARWVAGADTSAHVSGDAVDIGPFGATAWLSEHGAQYGLCQTYRHEPWHYELRREAASLGCPRMSAEPAHLPGVQP